MENSKNCDDENEVNYEKKNSVKKSYFNCAVDPYNTVISEIHATPDNSFCFAIKKNFCWERNKHSKISKLFNYIRKNFHNLKKLVFR